ncbi:hypothetical protein B0H14DRAFT_2582840 [Mycena olivaceomarginata]|nr:hypothetical protein B0H14DRAFT_2582840 [Mycena olivaceomarginata]
MASGSLVRGNARRREPVPESICPPKMRKRWKAGGGLVAHQTHAPPRVDKGQGKARAQEEPMDVDVDFGVLAEEAMSVPVPVESDVPPTPSEQAASPPSPAWGTAVSLSPEPFAPALLAKLQRAKEGELGFAQQA